MKYEKFKNTFANYWSELESILDDVYTEIAEMYPEIYKFEWYHDGCQFEDLSIDDYDPSVSIQGFGVMYNNLFYDLKRLMGELPDEVFWSLPEENEVDLDSYR